MGSKNGKPVLRDEDVEDLVKSSGLSEDEVIMYSTYVIKRQSNSF